MLIKNSPVNQTSLTRPAASATGDVKDAAPKDTFKTAINHAARGTGGALGGLALGGVGGSILTRMTGNQAYTQFGGAVGAIGGAATTLALSMTDEPVSIQRTIGSWAAASAGAPLGMWLVGGLGCEISKYGGASYFGAYGAMLGAVAGGAAGVGLAFVGDESKIGKLAKGTARAGVGGTAGLLLGGAAQNFLQQNLPHLAPLGAGAPAMGAATLGLMFLNGNVNPGWFDGAEATGSVALDKATKSVLGGAAGFGVASVVSGIAAAVGGSGAYLTLGPAVGAALGASGALGMMAKNEDTAPFNAFAVGTLAASGLVVGDAIGHGLTALTGQSAFQTLGPAVGAVNGAVAGMKALGKGGRYGLPVVAGTSAGAITGTLLGAGLSALTGAASYQSLGTAIGAAAGLCAGLAAGANL
jgi:hypothetical protein